MTVSNDSLKFDIKYNFIQHQLSEFHLVLKYHFISIENGKFTVTKSVISPKSSHTTALIRNITGSNDSLKFATKYNHIVVQLFEFYSVQKVSFILSTENEKKFVTKPIISRKPLIMIQLIR